MHRQLAAQLSYAPRDGIALTPKPDTLGGSAFRSANSSQRISGRHYATTYSGVGLRPNVVAIVKRMA